MVYLYGIILGLVAGSFVNAWVYRLDSGESVLFERSHCVKCGKTLRWYDLIPLISFVNLKGKCRDCHKPISVEYPLVEIITALLYAGVIFYHQPVFNDISMWVSITYQMLMAVFLETIFIFDIRHYLIPDSAVIGAIISTAVYGVAEFLIANCPHFNTAAFLSVMPEIINHILAVILVSGFLWILAYVSKEKWMGWGDVRLALIIGIVLGYPNAVIALFGAFFIGAIIGLVTIVTKKKSFKAMIPFAPFLIIGLVIAFYWGDGINAWYRSIIGL